MAREDRRYSADILEQIRHRDPECLGDSKKSRDGDVFLTAFNSTEKVVVQVGLFRQSLQTETGTLPVRADGCSEQWAIIAGGWHSLSREQGLGFLSTPLNGLFLQYISTAVEKCHRRRERVAPARSVTGERP